MSTSYRHRWWGVLLGLSAFALFSNGFMIEIIHKINVVVICNIITEMSSEFADVFRVID